MKKKLLVILAVLLALVCIVSTAVTLYKVQKEKESAESNALAHELVALPSPPPSVSPEPEPSPSPSVTDEDAEEPVSIDRPLRDAYAEALADTDLGPLREINSDVLGWIEIPDTRISYPLLQCDNNDYYLSRSWQKWENPAGAIFLEYQNAPDFSDFNTLIYGHRMSGGDMFGTLYMFSEQEYMDAHPRIYIVDDSGCRVYDIFAAYEVTVDSRIYAMNFSNDAYKQAYIDHCLGLSHVESNAELSPEDNIITLSTCSRASGKNYRYIVQAVYVDTVPRSQISGQEIS